MTVPPDENGRAPDDGVSLEKNAAPADFDPYRFGAPEHPVPPEYAPPGYTPPPQTAPPSTPPPGTSPPPPYGYPAYGQYGAHPQYGAPPPPQYSQYPQPATGNGKAVAGLVLGIASIVFCWTTVFDVVPVVLGLVFGFLGLNQSSRLPGRTGRGMAIAGIVCSVIGAALAIALTVWVVRLANDCGGFGTDSTVLQQCIQNHI